MHRPELVLRACGFCRLRRQSGVGIHLTQREMAEHEAHSLAKMLARDFHRRVSLTAVGALEVSVLDKDDPGRLWTHDVIAVAHRDCKHIRFRVLVHRDRLLTNILLLMMLWRSKFETPKSICGCRSMVATTQLSGVSRPFSLSFGRATVAA